MSELPEWLASLQPEIASMGKELGAVIQAAYGRYMERAENPTDFKFYHIQINALLRLLGVQVAAYRLYRENSARHLYREDALTDQEARVMFQHADDLVARLSAVIEAWLPKLGPTDFGGWLGKKKGGERP